MCNYYEQSLNELQFYFSSADKKPTKGAGEKYVVDFQGLKFLSEFKDWRKVLSNFYVTQDPLPFEVNIESLGRVDLIDRYHFKTVEHIYQAMKYFTNGYTSLGMKFTIESGDPIGQGDGLDARKGRKLVKLSQKELDKWFKRSKSVMIKALEIKFSQDATAKTVLNHTFPCKLFHTIPRKPREHWEFLEIVRNKKIFDDIIDDLCNKEKITPKEAREIIEKKIINVNLIPEWN